ncbi:MAG: SDR family NAD(P)-dependent oxidoreductase, partial [Candidatus Viridilinea halotolerans]
AIGYQLSAIDYFPSLRPNQPALHTMLSSLGRLYERGVVVNWPALHQGQERRKIVLPTYPFQRQRYWVELETTAVRHAQGALAGRGVDEVLAQLVAQGSVTPNDHEVAARVLAGLLRVQAEQEQDAAVDQCSYALAWQPVASAAGPTDASGAWLLVAEEHDLTAALVAALQAHGGTVTLLPPAALLDDATVVAAEPWRGVICLAGLAASLPPADVALDEATALLIQAQADVLHPLLRLVQQLASHTPQRAALPFPPSTTLRASLAHNMGEGAGGEGHAAFFTNPDVVSPPRLWVVTQGAQAVTGSEAVQPLAALLWGLGRVAAREHAEFWGGLVDLDPTDVAEPAATHLLAALLANDSEPEVALRRGQRWVSRLERRTLPVAQPLPLRADATYMITGGLGGLGRTVADWLVQRGVRHLVLMGRRGAQSAEQQAAVAQWEAVGVTVEVAQVDVADGAALAPLFQRLASSDAPLKGIFHAAGVSDDSILLSQTWARCAAVLAPKVTGTWLLHRLSETFDLDLFVLFSSLSSLIGNRGLGSYAAANAFLDGLAALRQQQRLSGLSINWGAWAEIGMAAHTKLAAVADWPAMTVALGLRALERSLTQHGSIALFQALWAQMGANIEILPRLLHDLIPSSRSDVGLVLNETFGKQLAALPLAKRRSSVTNRVEMVLMRVLGLSEVPDAQIGFTDLGMDSLMALELRRQLEGELGLSLPATLAFEYPTVVALGDYLFTTVLGLAEAPATPPQLEADAAQFHAPLAIVSMACRVPGADTPEALWRILQTGCDQVQVVPASRWSAADY